MTINPESSAVKSVTYYMASGPVECCDRCSAGIRHVFLVRYKDGQTQRYGSECINRILDAKPTLRSLFHKNAKLAKKYNDYLAIFSGSIESMPRGREYFGSGLYFIADSEGKDVFFDNHWYFHPVFDAEKNAAGNHYVVTNPAEHMKRNLAAIERDKPKIVAEITRLESFLAKIIRNCGQEKTNELS